MIAATPAARPAATLNVVLFQPVSNRPACSLRCGKPSVPQYDGEVEVRGVGPLYFCTGCAHDWAAERVALMQ